VSISYDLFSTAFQSVDPPSIELHLLELALMRSKASSYDDVGADSAVDRRDQRPRGVPWPR
jgi:hypothetical protein